MQGTVEAQEEENSSVVYAVWKTNYMYMNWTAKTGQVGKGVVAKSSLKPNDLPRLWDRVDLA